VVKEAPALLFASGLKFPGAIDLISTRMPTGNTIRITTRKGRMIFIGFEI
jgi:hypothetical protein